MQSSGFSGGQYRPLSEEKIKMIHNASLEILEKVGFTYGKGLDNTLDMLEGAGAAVDRGKFRIRFPKKLIMEQAARAPEHVILYSRDGKNDLDLGKDRVYMGTGGAAIKILDLETGKVRASTLNDLFQLGCLVDKLDNIHFFLRPCIPQDIPPSSYDVNVFYSCFKATAKHIMSGVNSEKDFQDIIELASIIAGSRENLVNRPFFSITASFAISPLKLNTQSTLIMQEACRHRIPVALSSAPAAGSTSPITMAGTLAQLHAEELVGVTICQLTNPGCPILYGGIPGAVDLYSMGYMGGAVECGMMNAAIHQMSRYLKIPNYNSSGLTDSKLPDVQAGWEKAFTSVLAAMGGSNYIHHAAGMLESMLTVAYEQYVIDDEIIGMSCQVLRGIEVDREHLAVEAIAEAGPGGDFMMNPHTLKHMRSEFFQGNGISDRKNRERWEAEGSLSARERARIKAKNLISQEQNCYISADADKNIKERFDILL